MRMRKLVSLAQEEQIVHFCLLLIFATLSQLRHKITVLHYNHKLRGKDADEDEAFVKKMSLQLGLKFISESDQVATQKTDENSLRKKTFILGEIKSGKANFNYHTRSSTG